MKHIIVAGAGFGGWYTALSLLGNLDDVRVTVIGSSKIPKLPVGEALAWDAPYNWKRLLKLKDDRVMMRATGSIYKYAVEYSDFFSNNVNSYHSKMFNLKINSLVKFFSNFDYPDYHEPYNIKPGEYGTLDAWLWCQRENPKTMDQFVQEQNDAFFFATAPLAPYNSRNEFILRDNDGYAYHIDADKSYRVLKQLAAERHADRLQEIDAVIVDVKFDEQGLVSGLLLDTGELISADLYCDVTGLRRAIISKMPDTDWQDLNKYFEDTAIVSPSIYTDPEKEMIGATKFSGADHGWMFKINLYHRIGNGYIFKSDLATNDTIHQHLEATVGTKVDPLVVKWNPGYYNKSWSGNVVSLGISSGLISPFDGNTITTQSRGIENIITVMQRNLPIQDQAEEYNKLQWPAFEEIKLRLKMLFAFSKRSGNFWDLKRQLCKDENLIEKLEDIISRKTADIDSRFTWNWQQGYGRLIAQAGIDISKFKLPKPSDSDLEMARAFWAYNVARNKYISQSKWPNYYLWLKDNRFEGRTSKEMFDELDC